MRVRVVVVASPRYVSKVPYSGHVVMQSSIGVCRQTAEGLLAIEIIIIEANLAAFKVL